MQQRCPEWTDHNVSDPGVTLIETFAFMTDELLYRLNRVPDRLYVTFLDLLGVSLHPPTPARVDVTAWLSAAAKEEIVLPQGAEVATLRTSQDEAVVFATTEALSMPPHSLGHVMTHNVGDDDPDLRDDELSLGTAFECFTAAAGVRRRAVDRPRRRRAVVRDRAPVHLPRAGRRRRPDAATVGVGGLGRQLPGRPARWISDGTGGLNRPGDVILHVPREHRASVIGGVRAGWLRCRVVAPAEGYPFYSASPTITEASAYTIGGTVPAIHAETVTDEVLGLSEGVPGQVFALTRGPLVADGIPLDVEVAAGSGWERWREVESFADCTPEDRAVRADHASGEIQFGPAVREPDGGLRHHGAVPPKGAPLRVPSYRVGGGPDGNVSAGSIRVLRTTVPGVDRVENRRAAIGGTAAETVEEAKLRGPLALRTRDRAVTCEDYEQLALAAAPQLARVKAMPARSEDEAGGVRVLVVPSAPVDAEGRLRFEDLVPTEETLQGVATYVDERRTVGARVVVEPPFYQGVTVVATLVARARTSSEDLQRAALRGAPPLLRPAHRRPGRARLAVRPAGAGGRGLRRAPAAVRHRAGRRGAALRRGPDHRQAGRAGAAARPRPVRAGVLLRPPGPGGARWLRRRSRGLVPGLDNPVPIAQRLPGVLQDDDFLLRFVAAFDDSYAPIRATLDSLACYFDPQLAPADFLDWLATWVGVDLDDAWSLEQRRRIVADAARVHRQRGTTRGVVAALELALGAEVEVSESGACTWSSSPGADPGGSSPAVIEARITVADPDAVDVRRIESLLESVTPAHVARTYSVHEATNR